MDWFSLLGFLFVVFLGAYVQAVAGFAMAMLIVAVAGGLRLLDIPTLAVVVSFTTLLNVILALRGHGQDVHRPLARAIVAGQIPGLLLGLAALSVLASQMTDWLYLVLGLFITAGGLSMALHPQPWAQVTSSWGSFLVGMLGGVVGGLFAASGPVLGWFGYNQPLGIEVIRATLLFCFACSTLLRLVFVGVDGAISQTALVYAAIAVPVVVLGTWLGRRFQPVASPDTLKRAAYMLLLVMGLWILISALTSLLS